VSCSLAGSLEALAGCFSGPLTGNRVACYSRVRIGDYFLGWLGVRGVMLARVPVMGATCALTVAYVVQPRTQPSRRR